MSKRTAHSDLNADNWDAEEEPEEAGEFKQANAKVLATRVIRKAKRRGTDPANPEEGAPKAFAGFAGFSSKPSSGSTPLSGFSNGTTSQTTKSTASSSIFSCASSTGAGFSMSSSAKTSPGIFGGSSLSTPAKPVSNGSSTDGKSVSSSKYLHQLKALNESVTKWIQTHVGKNPYCILTPIFKDYEKHLDEINKKFPEEAKQSSDENKEEEKKEETKKEKDEPSSVSTKTEKPDNESTSKPAETKGFSFGGFGGASTTEAASSGSGFKFASLGGNTSGFSGFTPLGKADSAGTSSGFSFAVSKPVKEEAAGDEEEEYVPPKPESSSVTEEDATYTKKCKLFYKKDSGWAERGLGNIFLKPCGEKNQLLIRADTSIGNILLNIMLTTSIPISRQGKNNVALICIPNPPIEEKKGADDSGDAKTPVSMLIKVKTSEDADELLEKLNEAKR